MIGVGTSDETIRVGVDESSASVESEWTSAGMWRGRMHLPGGKVLSRDVSCCHPDTQRVRPFASAAGPTDSLHRSEKLGFAGSKRKGRKSEWIDETHFTPTKITMKVGRMVHISK